MKKNAQELSEIAAIFKDYVINLRNLADQTAQLGCRIAKISLEFGMSPQNLDEADKPFPDIKTRNSGAVNNNFSRVISFPEAYQAAGYQIKLPVPSKERFFSPPFLAMPGNILPADIPDFRPVLQRDGLILLAWDKRKTGKGHRFTAYWVTSAGVPRFYSSKLLSLNDFPLAQPNRKSYAAEDGIDFYGQEAPVYMVHVAPELMKSNPRHRELRAVHINILKHYGSKVDFNYKYLLKNEKSRNRPLKKEMNYSSHSVGA